jgi:hypothetical protein
MENLLDRFFSFANTFYSMFTVKSKVKDDRKSPQISPSVIFLSLLFLVLFKIGVDLSDKTNALSYS